VTSRNVKRRSRFAGLGVRVAFCPSLVLRLAWLKPLARRRVPLRNCRNAEMQQAFTIRIAAARA
jgi:hypothetical protein